MGRDSADQVSGHQVPGADPVLADPPSYSSEARRYLDDLSKLNRLSSAPMGTEISTRITQ
jgi:hypothetical protein